MTTMSSSVKRFRWITYEQALTMTRGEILEWLGVANERWMRDGAPVGPKPRDEAHFQEFRKIMRLIDPMAAVLETKRTVLGQPGPSYWDQLPTLAED